MYIHVLNLRSIDIHGRWIETKEITIKLGKYMEPSPKPAQETTEMTTKITKNHPKSTSTLLFWEITP